VSIQRNCREQAWNSRDYPPSRPTATRTRRDRLAYAARRLERTAAVQSASREAGRLVQLVDPAEVAARNARRPTARRHPLRLHLELRRGARAMADRIGVGHGVAPGDGQGVSHREAYRLPEAICVAMPKS
jgi:hypothetical protein